MSYSKYFGKIKFSIDTYRFIGLGIKFSIKYKFFEIQFFKLIISFYHRG